MPKVRKLRPDGASLSQVYESKREDVWGKILKEQILEEDKVNMEKKVRKDLADANYGKSLRQQRKDRDAIDRSFVDRGEVMTKSKGVVSEQSAEGPEWTGVGWSKLLYVDLLRDGSYLHTANVVVEAACHKK